MKKRKLAGRAMMKKKVAFWDDERSIGNSLIVTLKDGWEFGTDTFESRHVEGFDTVADAKEAVLEAIKCNCCEDCKKANG